MAREYINGRLYINGYATDDSGRPRTVYNGYSSEDEVDAHEDYLEAKHQAKNPKPVESEKSEKQDSPNVENPNNNKPKKISKKQQLKMEEQAYKELASLERYYQIGDDFWDVEYINGSKYIGGYATNEIGEPICFETGYGDEDVRISQQMYKDAHKPHNFVF